MIAAVETGWQLREAAWLWLLLAVAAVALWRARARRARGPVALQVDPSGFADGPPLPRTLRMRLAFVPAFAEAAALAAFVVALARPVEVEVEPPARLGRDVLLCFDRSSSMAETDLAPGRSRLSIGKELAAEFVAARGDDRLGIVTFARFADLVCPPTADHDAVVELLRTVRMVDAEGPEDATAIGAAVGMAAELLLRSDSPGGKVLVLLTDGEENVATEGAVGEIAPLHAGQWCRDRGIRVHTIALGKGERAGDGSWRALDTTAVQQLAKLTGGRFFAAADAAALRAVYGAIDRLEAARFAEPGVRVREHYAWPTALGLLLLALAHMARCSRAGGTP